MRCSILLSILISVPILASETTIDREFEFAEQFFKENDYYRAHVEFMRIGHFNRANPKGGLAFLRAAESAYLGRRFELVEKVLEEPEIPFQHKSWLMAYSLAQRNRYNLAVKEAKKDHLSLTEAARLQILLWKIQASLNTDSAFNYAEDLAKLNWNKIDNADTYAVKIGAPLPPKEEIISDLSHLWPNDKKKQPAISVLLSTILPGLGQAYSEDWANSISSFAVVAALGATAALSFVNSENTLGYILAAGSGIFYAGNIYGAYNSAMNKNELRMRRFNEKIEEWKVSYQVYQF